MSTWCAVLKVKPHTELLAPLWAFGERQAELRRLLAALVAEPVVDVEHVEHFPECRRLIAPAKAEDLADPQVGALLGRPAARVARLRTIGKWIGVELKAGAHAEGQRAAIRAESGELHVDFRHEVRRVDDKVVATVVVVGTE